MDYFTIQLLFSSFFLINFRFDHKPETCLPVHGPPNAIPESAPAQPDNR